MKQHKVVQHLVRDNDTNTSDYKGSLTLCGMGFVETRKIPGFHKEFFHYNFSLSA